MPLSTTEIFDRIAQEQLLLEKLNVLDNYKHDFKSQQQEFMQHCQHILSLATKVAQPQQHKSNADTKPLPMNWQSSSLVRILTSKEPKKNMGFTKGAEEKPEDFEAYKSAAFDRFYLQLKAKITSYKLNKKNILARIKQEQFFLEAMNFLDDSRYEYIGEQQEFLQHCQCVLSLATAVARPQQHSSNADTKALPQKWLKSMLVEIFTSEEPKSYLGFTKGVEEQPEDFEACISAALDRFYLQLQAKIARYQVTMLKKSNESFVTKAMQNVNRVPTRLLKYAYGQMSFKTKRIGHSSKRVYKTLKERLRMTYRQLLPKPPLKLTSEDLFPDDEKIAEAYDINLREALVARKDQAIQLYNFTELGEAVANLFCPMTMSFLHECSIEHKLNGQLHRTHPYISFEMISNLMIEIGVKDTQKLVTFLSNRFVLHALQSKYLPFKQLYESVAHEKNENQRVRRLKNYNKMGNTVEKLYRLGYRFDAKSFDTIKQHLTSNFSSSKIAHFMTLMQAFPKAEGDFQFSRITLERQYRILITLEVMQTYKVFQAQRSEEREKCPVLENASIMLISDNYSKIALLCDAMDYFSRLSSHERLQYHRRLQQEPQWIKNIAKPGGLDKFKAWISSRCKASQIDEKSPAKSDISKMPGPMCPAKRKFHPT